MASMIQQTTNRVMTFDALMEVPVRKPNEIPEHPIDGVDFDYATDHVRKKLDKYTVRCIITASPWTTTLGTFAGPQVTTRYPQPAPPVTALLNGVAQLPTNVLPIGPERLQVAADFLEEVRDQLITLVTRKLGVLENMGIKDIAYVEDNKERFEFVLELTQMQFVEAAFVTLPPELIRRAPDKPKSDLADQSGADVRGRTIAQTGARAVTKLFTGLDTPQEYLRKLEQEGGFFTQ